MSSKRATTPEETSHSTTVHLAKNNARTKKVLIVIAHPSSKSFSHTMASRYQAGVEALGHEVKILDLYRDQGAKEAAASSNASVGYGGFMAYEDIEELRTNPLGNYFRENFLSWADEYVFFFPVWWFDSPAILKNFYDVSFISGFGFKYVNRRGVGLLTNKSAKVFVTSDGPGWAYKLGFVPLVSTWNWRLSYCGIKVKRVAVLGEKRWQDEKTCEKWLKSNIDSAVTY